MRADLMIEILLARLFPSRPACPPLHTSLLGRPHYACDGARQLLPFGFLERELLPAGGSQPVELHLAAAVTGRPFRRDPALAVQPVQGRIERAMLHLQN